MKKEIFRFGVAAIALIFCIALGLTSFASVAAAQNSSTQGTLKGIITDEEKKPVEGAVVLIKSQATGTEVQTKTDATGKYSQGGLAGGSYDVTFMVNDEIVYNGSVKVIAGHDIGVNVSLSDPDVRAYREKIKTINEGIKKSNSMKEHFDAGTAALTHATDLRKLIAQTPADQKEALQAKIDTFATQAIQEFQLTLKALGDETSGEDKRTVYSQMGNAYDAEEKYDEEAAVLRIAAEMPPPAAAFYNNLGNALAKAGKLDEATAAFDKSATLDPKGAGQAYRNLGVVLFNAGKLANPGVVDILKKATDLDPTNAQGWFLYGAALAANMQAKQVGDKMIFTLLPGTVEAYQKCIELSPTGPLAAQARGAIDELKAMGLGIDTKVTTPKVKH
ncbi:MAG TPA: carboxypeptidase regulatory-like domain-containing protein [Candidatus Acidoferrales bacterium]|nr:carboxypeptidase regulatory-like domain-containing protein [Candidatus Acidoferrales bacterium]